jgi:hypothetical protein
MFNEQRRRIPAKIALAALYCDAAFWWGLRTDREIAAIVGSGD